MVNDPRSQMEQDINSWSQQRLNLWYKDTVDRSQTAGIEPRAILANIMINLIQALALMAIIGKIPTDVVYRAFLEALVENINEK